MNGKEKFKMSHEAVVALLECLGTSHMFHIERLKLNYQQF